MTVSLPAPTILSPPRGCTGGCARMLIYCLLEPIMSSRGRKAPGTKKTRKGARLEGTPEAQRPVVNLLRADSIPPGNDSQASVTMNGFQTPSGSTPIPNGLSVHSMSHMEIDHDRIDDTHDVEYQAWKTMTKKARAKVAVSSVIGMVLGTFC